MTNNLNKKYIYIVFLLIAVFSIYRSDFIMYDLVDKVNSTTNNLLKLTYVRDRVVSAIDGSIPSLGVVDNASKIPIINIRIKKDNFNQLSSVLKISQLKKNKHEYISSHDNKYLPIKLNFNDSQNYKAKIKLAGTSLPNFSTKKYSFAIKLSNKTGYLKNMRRFQLVPLSKMGIDYLFFYDLLEKYTNINVVRFVARLKVNNIDQGLYLVEERLHKEVLERNGLAGVDVFKPLDEWNHQYSNQHVTPYTASMAGVRYTQNSKKNVGQLLRYKKLTSSSHYDDIKDIVNIDSFARVEALRMLLFDYHSIEGDNNRILYDSASGRFFPFLRSEGKIINISSRSNLDSLDKDLYNRDNGISLYRILTKEDKFRAIRNQYLYDIVSDKAGVLSAYDKHIKRYKNAILKDNSDQRYPGRTLMNRVYKKKRIVENNIDFLYKYLTYSKVYFDIEKKKNNHYTLSIHPDSNAPISISDFFVKSSDGNDIVSVEDYQDKTKSEVRIKDLNKYFEDRKFSLSLDNGLNIIPNTYKYDIKGVELTRASTDIKFVNTLNDKEISIRKVQYQFINSVNISKNQTAKDLLDNSNLNLSLSKKVFTLSGDNKVNKDLIFPYGYELIIEPGTTIEINKGKSIVTYGDVLVRGSSKRRVVIRSATNEPFGVFAAIGDSKSNIDIKYLDISNGSEAIINGSYISGALSFYNHKLVTINNSNIFSNVADDGLNIKKSSIVLTNNYFYNNFADNVDLDVCIGVISDNIFENKVLPQGAKKSKIFDINGDGIDLSGSDITLYRNILKGFPDKGISIGEASNVVIFDNDFIENNSAITVKDGSKAYLISNKYDNNNINIDSYVKKPIFPPPSIYSYNEKHGDDVKLGRGSEYYFSEKSLEPSQLEYLNIFKYLNTKVDWILKK
jgi:hypothetical protein